MAFVSVMGLFHSFSLLLFPILWNNSRKSTLIRHQDVVPFFLRNNNNLLKIFKSRRTQQAEFLLLTKIQFKYEVIIQRFIYFFFKDKYYITSFISSSFFLSNSSPRFNRFLLFSPSLDQLILALPLFRYSSCIIRGHAALSQGLTNFPVVLKCPSKFRGR